jgi:hypothetical protein
VYTPLLISFFWHLTASRVATGRLVKARMFWGEVYGLPRLEPELILFRHYLSVKLKSVAHLQTWSGGIQAKKQAIR